METATELRGEHVLLRPLASRDGDELRAIRSTPEVSAWWGRLEDDFPSGDDPRATRMTVVVEGAVAGLVQFTEEPEPEYRHAEVDLFIDPRLHGRGVGTDAVATLVRHLLEDRGHHRLTIVPAADNAAAIRCYEKAGFSRVGVTRSSWRDPDGRWRDELLMELVVPPA
jgi:aminoglycoside 6'-N-acetyltransferase